MKLPNGERADLGTKLEDYSLNPLHRHGQHKARDSGLSLALLWPTRICCATPSNKPLPPPNRHTIAATTDSAKLYELRFPLTTGQGAAVVLSAWIILKGEDFPRLTTCFIL